MTYTLICVKGRREFRGSLDDAIEAAGAMEEELQPAFGVTVEDETGAVIAEVRDGHVLYPE